MRALNAALRDRDLGPDEARLLFAVMLFEDARVSLGYAAGMGGYSTSASRAGHPAEKPPGQQARRV